MSTLKICAIDGCANPVTARGWCKNHYARWRTHGDPMLTKRGVASSELAERLRSLKGPQTIATRREETRAFRAALRTLSGREREFLVLRCRGYSNNGVGDLAYVSDQTVKNTITSVLRKLLPATGAATMNGVCWRLGYEVALLEAQKGIAESEAA